MVVKYVPGDPPKIDSCPSCALAKAQRLLFKASRMRATAVLELIHGDLIGPIPVESVSRCKYRIVLMDDYSRASWVLPERTSYSPLELLRRTLTRSTPDPWTIRDALDANEWRAAMDIEIENMRHLSAFHTVPRPPDTNFITLRWVFHRKFENGALVKHKTCLVARGFTQVSGVGYNEEHLYAPSHASRVLQDPSHDRRLVRPPSSSIRRLSSAPICSDQR